MAHGEPTCTVASPGVGMLIKLVAGGQRHRGLAQHAFPAVSPMFLDHGRPILPLTRAISAPARTASSAGETVVVAPSSAPMLASGPSRQVVKPGTVVLDAPVAPAGDPVTAQHLQDHVLGRAPRGQLAVSRTPDLRHLDMQRFASDGQRRPRRRWPACPAIRQRAGMRVRAQQRFAGLAEALHVRGMGDAVTRFGNHRPKRRAAERRNR